MKRVLAAATLTLAGLAALLGFKTRDLSAAEPPTTTAGAASGPTTEVPVATATTASGPTTTVPATTTTSAGNAGTVAAEGSVIDTRYGPVQVSVVVTDGVLTDVIALQLPSGDRESDQINAYAAPLLREMALEAQSAQIDVVSGATFTSQAYAESLQGALDAAGL